MQRFNVLAAPLVPEIHKRRRRRFVFLWKAVAPFINGASAFHVFYSKPTQQTICCTNNEKQNPGEFKFITIITLCYALFILYLLPKLLPTLHQLDGKRE